MQSLLLFLMYLLIEVQSIVISLINWSCFQSSRLKFALIQKNNVMRLNIFCLPSLYMVEKSKKSSLLHLFAPLSSVRLEVASITEINMLLSSLIFFYFCQKSIDYLLKICLFVIIKTKYSNLFTLCMHF